MIIRPRLFIGIVIGAEVGNSHLQSNEQLTLNAPPFASVNFKARIG